MAALQVSPSGPMTTGIDSTLKRAYLITLVVAASAVLANSFSNDEHVLRHPALTITFVLVVVITESLPLRWFLLKNGEITASRTFAVGIILIESPLVAVLSMLAGSIAAESFRRNPPSKVVFNAARLVLSLSAAAWVFDVAGQSGVLIDPDRHVGPMWIIAMVAAGFLLLMVNAVLSSLNCLLSGGTTLVQLGRRGLLVDSHADGALLALAPSVVVVSQRSIFLLPLGLLMVMVIHRLARRVVAQEHDATHDGLTGLWNRRAFLNRLDSTVAAFDRSARHGAVIVLDLDGFKAINDMLGHHVGDQVLRDVAQRIVAMHGPNQISARLGGDEFATLVGHASDRQDVVDWSAALHAALSEPYTSLGFPVHLSASIGIAMMDDPTDTPAELLQAADLAMYAAKRNSLGVHVHNRRATGHDMGRLNLIAELEGALERNELFVEYQPQVNCATGAVFGFEALLRWQHPMHGLVAPDVFMPLAEQTDLMKPITRFVLDRAMTDLAVWRAAGWPLRVAVNVSAQNLHSLDFPAVVRDVLSVAGVPGSALELEITENAVMTKREVIRDVLVELRAIGARIVIDDFGTGYSSLANMRHLPLDGVKVDRSFILDLDHDHDDLIIVKSIIELARNLHLESTAEGVESATAWNRLAQLGCDNIHGFLVARPMAAHRVTDWIRAYHAQIGLTAAETWPRQLPSVVPEVRDAWSREPSVALGEGVRVVRQPL